MPSVGSAKEGTDDRQRRDGGRVIDPPTIKPLNGWTVGGVVSEGVGHPTPMTPHEKAVNAINVRLERLQANLRETNVEALQRFLFQSMVATVAVAEGLNDYIRAVGAFAERRHREVKQANEALTVQHAELLKAAQEQLEKLKANPTDRAIRKEIDRAQQSMATIQKSVRRGANVLQRETAPCLALIDAMAMSLRKLTEADQRDALQRHLRTIIGLVRDFYATFRGLPAKNVIDAAGWENAVAAEIEQSVDFYDAYARVGFQATLATELIAMAVSENPPRTATEAMQRGNDAAATRLKQIAARIAPAEPPPRSS